MKKRLLMLLVSVAMVAALSACGKEEPAEEVTVEFEEEAEVIASSIKSGKCVKTVRFENSLDLENITAKFTNGIVIINIPKLIIPKHKITPKM